MVDDLRALAVFAETVERGSFRAAATALGLSPSVVSHHVSQLETRLGVPLLYRTTRRLALTPDGRRLFSAAREMSAAAQRGLDELAGRAENPAGELRLTVPAFLADTGFAACLADFSRAFPQVHLTVSYADTRGDLLRDHLDLAIRLGRLEDSSLYARRLGELQRVLVAAPAVLLENGTPEHPSDLERWPGVRLTSRPPELALTHDDGHEFVATLRSRIAVDNVAAVRGLALSGVGLASLPEVFVRSHVRAGALVVLLPKWRLAAIGIHAVWPEHGPRPALTRRFVEFVARPGLSSLIDTIAASPGPPNP